MEDYMFSYLNKNKEVFDRNFENSADYFFKDISVMGCKGAVVMCEDLTDSLKLWEVFLRPLNNLSETAQPEDVFDYIKNKTTIPFNPNCVNTFSQAMFFLTAGFALLMIDGINQAFVMPVQGYPARGVDKPTNEGNLKGSKESFTDVGRKNMGMIRRRIRSNNLVVTTMQVGSKTKTEITVYYHSDYCPEELADSVINRIKNIDLPMIFEAGYISPFIDRTKGSVFQSVGYTERPDTFCAKLCEGKVGIIIDGTPYAIIYPFFFNENFITNDDYTQRPYFASFIRIIRYLSFAIAVALPGLYIAFTSYTPQTLAKKLLFAIYSSQNNTPLPLFVEAIVITVLLEIIKEAGLRLPTPIGSSVSIVSALIIGDAAVSAGLIGNTLLIICGLSTIAAFIIPSFYEAIIVMRLLFIVMAGVFGLPGVCLSVFYLLANIFILESNNINNNWDMLNDGIVKNSWRNNKGSVSIKEQYNEK